MEKKSCIHTDITPELWADMKEIQASMAIEGFELSEEQLERAALRYLKSAIPKQLEALRDKADREGRPYAEVVAQAFGFKLDPRLSEK